MKLQSASPLVSVVLPVFNAQEYLVEAIESILGQTFKNYELIIINDGSEDNTQKLLEKLEEKDERILVFHRKNHGLVDSLNYGIQMSKGKYIARMDADDISLPDRLLEQVSFLESEADIDIVGCDYSLIDQNGEVKRTIKVPKTEQEIIFSLCYSVPFAHPSVLIRKKIFDKFTYRKSPIEDYLLWTDIFTSSNFANLDKVLFLYRHQYGSSFSDSKRLEMIAEEKIISRHFISMHYNDIKRHLINSSSSVQGKPRALLMFCFNSKVEWLVLMNNYRSFVKLIFQYSRTILRKLYWLLPK